MKVLSVAMSSFVLTTAAISFGSPSSAQIAPEPPKVRSTLQTIRVDEANPTTVLVYSRPDRFEAPNWTPDGASLIFDADGKIMKIAVGGGTPEAIDIGAASRCNGSHGLSPDGKLLAITCTMPNRPGARVFVLPSGGGIPQAVTDVNSYWHSWSPDGKTILFTRPERAGGGINFHSIGIDGQNDKPLTQGAGTNDDPDFSPDGHFIYFNSDRNGTTQIWRIHPDGSAPEQITSDEMVNWTPHPSPDGKSLVFLSYEKGTTGHPANRNVMLRLMSLSDHKVKVLVRFVGGAGSINVPSWAPDGKRLAFVSYEVLSRPVALQTSSPEVPAFALPGSATHAQVSPPADFHKPSRNFDTPIGIFEGQSDVGSAVVPGSASFDTHTKQYTMNSAGYNVWYTRDEFRYAWKKMSGDISLAADVEFPRPDGYSDRKAILVIRQNLDDDSKEAIVALHGEGMIHLAQRPEKGLAITDLEYRVGGRGRAGGANASSLVNAMARRIGVEKHGDTFSLFVSVEGEPMHQFGPPIQLHLDGPFYVGIGFCSHVPDKSDTAILSNVVLKNSAGKVF